MACEKLTDTKALRRLACALMAALLCFFGWGCCKKEAAVKTEQKQKIVLEFYNTMEGAEALVMPDILRSFSTENPDIEIKETPVDFYKAKKRFIAEAKSGKGPDILRADRFWLHSFASQGLIEALNPEQLKAEINDMAPIARAIAGFDDKIWALPISLDCLALFYNKKHFAEKKVNAPKSFDEFAAAALALTDVNLGRYGFFIYPNAWYFEPFVFGFGGQYFDEKGNLSVNSDPARKSLEFLLHLKNVLKVVPPTNLRDDVYDSMIRSFGSGQVSMIFAGPWAIRSIIECPAFKDDNSNLGITQLPEGPHGTFSPTGCQSLVISKHCKNKSAALKFLRFMYSTNVQVSLSMANFGLPARRSAFAKPELKRDPYLQTFIKQMQMSKRIINSPRRGEIYEPLGEKLTQVLTGETTPAYALSDFAEEWKRHP